jgi:hypothetical protein
MSRKVTKVVVLSIACFGFAGLIFGQSSEIQLTRAMIQTERQAIVADNMQLPEQQGERFWPLYRDYRNDWAKLGDRAMKLINTYAENYENLSDQTAGWMVTEFLEIEKSKAALRESWAPRFKEVLTSKELARFYQIENKLDAIVNYDLAGAIPLVK